MTSRRVRLFLVFSAVLLLLQACNFPGRGQNDEPGNIATAAAQTIQAGLAQDGAVQATATNTPETPGDGAQTATATSTLIPTITLTPTITKTPIPCDIASYGADIDVTVPDGTEFSPGDTFTKTWRLTNAGSCTWTSGYEIIFDHGDQMDGPASQQLTSGTVAPGQSVDISVDLTAPATPGTYRGYWKLRNPSGQVFGIGASGTGAFIVEIEVVVELDFTFKFHNLHACGGLQYATVRVVNVGSEFFQSAQMTVEDLDTSTILYGPASNNKPYLPNANDCPPGNDDHDPGEAYYIAVSIGAAPPSGHDARFTLKMCTEDGLGGDCITKVTEFEIP